MRLTFAYEFPDEGVQKPGAPRMMAAEFAEQINRWAAYYGATATTPTSERPRLPQPSGPEPCYACGTSDDPYKFCHAHAWRRP
jgi:hypothetical protein